MRRGKRGGKSGSNINNSNSAKDSTAPKLGRNTSEKDEPEVNKGDLQKLILKEQTTP